MNKTHDSRRSSLELLEVKMFPVQRWEWGRVQASRGPGQIGVLNMYIILLAGGVTLIV